MLLFGIYRRGFISKVHFLGPRLHVLLSAPQEVAERYLQATKTLRVNGSAAVELDAMYPAISDTQLQSPSTNGAQYDITSIANGFSSTDGNLPSSFSAFLADCSTESQKVGTDQLKVLMEAEMLYNLAKRMPGSSFHVLLNKMEKFISNMGGDLG